MAQKTISRFRKFQARVQSVLDEMGIISRNESEMHWLEKLAHFSVMVIKSFWRNRCPVRASALAYTTLLALVPLLAVAISISTSFFKQKGNERQITQLIDTFVAKVAPQLDLVSKSDRQPVTPEEKKLQAEMLAKYDANQNRRFDPVERKSFSEEDSLAMQEAGIGQVSAREKVAESISGYIKNVSSGTLGATAIIALVFVGISLLSTIEGTVNDIWGVAQGRSWFSRIVQYWALISLGPIVLLLVMGLNAGPYLESTQKVINFSPVIGNLVYEILPLLMLILAFAGFYQLMPNTKVKWQAALVGGIVGGCLWHLNNKFSVIYFGQVARTNAFYKQLAVLPVFLIGIYFSWLIVLFGAQVAYAFQNRRAYIQERQTENVNERGREFVALRMMTYIAERFHRGECPPGSTQIAESLCVPSQLISKVMKPLLQSKLVLGVASAVPNETAYAPGRPLDQISYQDILDSIRAGTGQELETRDEPAREIVRGKFDEIQEAEKRVAGEITLQSLVETGARSLDRLLS
jgi:membrane protein